MRQTGIVNRVARGEIIRGINHHIVPGHQRTPILSREAQVVGVHNHLRIYRLQPFTRHLQLTPPHIGGGV